MNNMPPMLILIGHPVYKSFNTNTIFFPSFTNSKIHPCRAPDSIPLGSEPLKSVCAINFITSSVISTGIKIGFSSYTSSIKLWGSFLCGCFFVSTVLAVSSVTPVLSDAISLGSKTPPDSCLKKI